MPSPCDSRQLLTAAVLPTLQAPFGVITTATACIHTFLWMITRTNNYLYILVLVLVLYERVRVSYHTGI